MERQRLCVRVPDACKMLSIGRTTLFSLDIPFVKINRIRLYRIKDLEAYLEAHLNNSEVTA
ncbi:MAG: helix-turn-helix domain-containing protein [Treponema sp.]|nr:helix-turn-helix domain-containing protein [Treponema sp.]